MNDDNIIQKVLKNLNVNPKTFALRATSSSIKESLKKKYWNRLHLQIIWYGREYCKARDCFGITCKICKSCYPNRKRPIKTKKA